MYRDIVRDHLQITDQFLETHCSTIVNRLEVAHGEMVKGDAVGGTSGVPSKEGMSGTAPKMQLQDTIYGINQCIHLASSLAVLGGAKNLQEAVEFIRKDDRFAHLDPTTVLTISMLNYLLRDYMGSEQTKATSTSPNVVPEILLRFDMVNWMIGREAMTALGIQTVSERTPVAAEVDMQKKSSH